MYKVVSICLSLISPLFLMAADAPSAHLVTLGQAFLQLNSQIREQTIAPDSAQLRFQLIFSELREVTDGYRQQICSDSIGFVFPIKSYDAEQIGGHGSGYRAMGFNLFDHAVQGSHPAHDIFIWLTEIRTIWTTNRAAH